MDRAEVIKIWKEVDAVCFDVDSTVCTDEGVDKLAEYCGVGAKVKEWTNQAMGGSVTFQESFDARLKIINPSLQVITKFVQSHPPSLTPGITELVAALKAKGCAVYLVSGGMLEIIEPVAKLLDIPLENVYANRLKYFHDGKYAGFDTEAPTCRSQGKPQVVGLLKEKFGYKRVAMIGDGATDLEAAPPADAFIGFGGNVVRQRVKENAKWFAYTMQELIDEL